MKNAIICILFGGFCAIVSCSAIRMGKSNIQVQKDSIKLPYYRPPSVPALNFIQPIEQGHNNRPFKDSLINGLMTINRKVDITNRKLDSTSNMVDSMFKRQTDAIKTRQKIVQTLFELQGTIVDLRLDTARLYKTATLSKDVKDDAVFGNTLKSFVVNVLIFIAIGIIVILILIIVFHQNLSNNIKRFKQHAT